MRAITDILNITGVPSSMVSDEQASPSSGTFTRDRRSSISAAISAIKSAAASLTGPSYERASIVEGDPVKRGHVICMTGWQVVWPGLNLLELTPTGLRLLTEDRQKVKNDMHISTIEEAGVNSKNLTQFFIRGQGPDGTTMWNLEGPSTTETADWVAMIRKTMMEYRINAKVAVEESPAQVVGRTRSTTAPPAFHPSPTPTAASSSKPPVGERSAGIAIRAGPTAPAEQTNVVSSVSLMSFDDGDSEGSESEDLLNELSITPPTADRFAPQLATRARAHTYSPGVKPNPLVKPKEEEWNPFADIPNPVTSLNAGTPASRQQSLDLL